MTDSKFTIVSTEAQVTLTLSGSAVQRVYRALDNDDSISGASEEYQLFTDIVYALRDHR